MDTSAPVGLRWPLRLSPEGRVVTTQSMPEIWDDRVRGLLSTREYERPMRPGFGCQFASAAFLGEGHVTPREALTEALRIHLPEITLSDIRVVIEDGGYRVFAEYRTPNGSLSESELLVEAP